MNKLTHRITVFFIVIFAFLLLGAIDTSAAVDARTEIDKRNQQIQEIERQIQVYQKQIEENSSKAKTLSGEIGTLNARIGSIRLEIKSLALSINQANSDISQTQSQINDALSRIDLQRKALTEHIQTLYQTDRENLASILLRNNRLSDFFDSVKNIENTQNGLRASIIDIKNLKLELDEKEDNLREKKSNFEDLKRIQESQKLNLDSTKGIKNKILADTRGQESRYQDLVVKSKKDIEQIRAQITYLQQNGVSAEEAVKYGQLAAIATGIRPAYLIAVLEVESGLGRNVGRCNRAEDPPEKHYRNIMKPDRDIEPFIVITKELGLDPETTAVSCPQFVNGKQYGWGGAMGPAQFIPSTWLGYKDDVSRIVGRPANPWNIEDAFTAAAVKLARGGADAKTRAAEIGASKAYYSGRSNCSSAPCNSYANAIINKAAIIEENL